MYLGYVEMQHLGDSGSPGESPLQKSRSLPPSFLGNCEHDAVSEPPFTPLRFKNSNMQCWQPCDKDMHTPALLGAVTGSFWESGGIIYQEP